MLHARLHVPLSLVLVLCACSDFPALDAALSDGARAAPYPDLVPVEQLTAQVDDPRITPETAPGIEARVAALRTRAARLRGSIIDSPTRERMTTGVTEG